MLPGYLVSSSGAAPSLPSRAQVRGKASSPFEVELWAQRDLGNWASDQGWDPSATPRSIWLQTWQGDFNTCALGSLFLSATGTLPVSASQSCHDNQRTNADLHVEPGTVLGVGVVLMKGFHPGGQCCRHRFSFENHTQSNALFLFRQSLTL